MSAGGSLVVDADTSKLAPKFRLAVESALEECAAYGLDAVVHEAMRSPELQMLYWLRGRPPTAEYPHPVTSARSVLYSWHGYGLAVDVISRSRRWFAPLPIASTDLGAIAAERERSRIEGERWFARVARIFNRYGCKWGGDWRPPHADPPHNQWGLCRASPSDRARELMASGGIKAVWTAVGAA